MRFTRLLGPVDQSTWFAGLALEPVIKGYSMFPLCNFKMNYNNSKFHFALGTVIDSPIVLSQPVLDLDILSGSAFSINL